MSSNIRIKKTNKVDEAHAIAIASPDYFVKECWSEIKRDLEKASFFGAFEGDEMIGFISYAEVAKGVTEIKWLAVKKEFRGQGIGSRLINETLKIIPKKYKLCKVRTLAETREDEGYSKTRKFYEKLGFYSIEIIDPYPYWSPGDPCQIYIKIV